MKRLPFQSESFPTRPETARGGHPRPMTFRGSMWSFLTLVALLVTTIPGRGVIVFGTDDPTHNTTAPTGVLAGSGWQWVGQFASAQATVIGPRHIVTAKHLAIGGAQFVFRGVTYRVTSSTNLSGTDLDVFTVAGRFPDYAPLCSSRREVGRPVVMIGRGGQRGEVFGTHGWKIGPYDGVQRWGTNVVDGTLISGTAELLQMSFAGNAGGDEGIFSSGDSGGGTFILDRDNVWKLAGVNYGVDGPFATSLSESPTMAAIHDARGLYIGYAGQQQLIPNGPSAVATRSFVSRISSSIAWLNARIAEPAPPGSVVLQSAADPDDAFAEEPFFGVDPELRLIEVPRTGNHRFFRAVGVHRLTVESVTDTLVRFRYE
jgi:hypothetical protein